MGATGALLTGVEPAGLVLTWATGELDSLLYAGAEYAGGAEADGTEEELSETGDTTEAVEEEAGAEL